MNVSRMGCKLACSLRRRWLATGMAIAVWLVAPLCTAFADETPLRIPRVSRAPKLSDFVNGTSREAEAVVTVFRQFDPHDGDPIS